MQPFVYTFTRFDNSVATVLPQYSRTRAYATDAVGELMVNGEPAGER